MPGKFFRKYLPDHATLRRHRFLRPLGPMLHSPNLWHVNRHSVAGGVAAGLFTGLLPAPFQIVSAAIAAIVLRVNLPVAVFTTLYTNPFTFVPLYLLGYKIGGLVTGGNTHGPKLSEFDWQQHPWQEILPEFFHWLAGLGETLLIGVLLEGALFALCGYFLVQVLWRLHVLHQWRRRREKRGKPG